MAQRKFIIDGGFQTSDDSSIAANLEMTGHILPTVDSDGTTGYDLGSTTKKWRDLFLSQGSLFIDGQKVLQSDSGTIVVSADPNQGLTTRTTGSGVLAFDSAQPISMLSTLQMGSGKKITDADGTAVVFGDKVDVDNNQIINVGAPTADTNAATKKYVDDEIDGLVNGAPGALDTLNELANALGDDSNFASTMTTSLATKAATTYVDSADSSVASAASTDATTKADAAQAAAATDATTKADAAQAAAISAAASDATTKANAAEAAAISAVTNGAGAAFDTLKEIQDAMATDAELSSAISSVTSSAASTAAADATSKANAAEAAAISTAATDATNKANAALASALAADSDTTYSVGDGGLTQKNFTSTLKSKLDGIAAGATNVTNNNQIANGAGYITSYTDTNTTYSAGNGLSLSGTTFLMSGSYSGSFTATGDITAYSDDSLKTNVQVIDGALGKVEAIRGVTFERIEDGSVSTGVIAQELKEVLPEAVHTDAEGVHSVAYGNITGLLIEAVKELSAQVEELKAK